VHVDDDPNISFTGQHQPAVTTPISTTDTHTVGNDFQEVHTVINTPGSGNFFIPIASIAVVVPVLTYTPVNALAFTPVTPPVQLQQAQVGEVQVAVFESTAAEERQVILQVMSPDGKVSEEVSMNEQVLDDLPKLFRQLPDGHYKIFVKEPGESGKRLLLDLSLRGGKPADDSTGGQDKPPTVEDEALEEIGEQDAAFNETIDVEIDGVAGEKLMPNRFSARGIGFVGPALPEEELVESAPATTGAAAILAGGALAGCIAEYDWEERVDAAMAETGAATLSKAARLARRLRRPDGRESSSWLGRKGRLGAR